MKTNCSLLLHLFFSLALLLGLGKPDPNPLQDYCIADNKSPSSFSTNGAPCIDPNKATSDHFTTSVLSKPTNTGTSRFGFNATVLSTINLPGLNTLGLTMSRIDIAANSAVPPHTHPRATEVLICLKGQLLVGFVDTSNRLYSQKVSPGDSFVFPKGLIHYAYNQDPKIPALVLAGFNSQNPGFQLQSRASFTSNPNIPDEVLKIAYQISNQDVTKIRRSLGG